MDEIIAAVSERLAAKVAELQFIDVDLEQLQLDTPPVDFPCALIDVSNVDYSSCGPMQQVGEVTLSITLGFKLLGASDNNSSEVLRGEAMAHYKIIDKVSAALHGFSTPAFATLNRVRLIRKAQTYPRHYTLTFKTQFAEVLD